MQRVFENNNYSQLKKQINMNKLNLEAYGVSEMNKQEMMETDGGFLGLLVVAAGLLLLGGCTVVINNGDNNTVNTTTKTDVDSTGNGNASGNTVKTK